MKGRSWGNVNGNGDEVGIFSSLDSGGPLRSLAGTRRAQGGAGVPGCSPRQQVSNDAAQIHKKCHCSFVQHVHWQKFVFIALALALTSEHS